MKNLIIGFLVLLALGLGGLAFYNQSRETNLPSSSPNTSIGQNGNMPTVSGKTLDLSGKGITEVGPDIYDKTDTVVLILSNNNLESLKSAMGKMTKLEVLKLDHNRLEGSLIGEIRKMPLRELDVSYNNMTGIPAEIGQLAKLETLDYSYNKIDTYPNEIANLKQLKTLKLTGNPFSAEKVAEIQAKLPNTIIVF